jgi:hypothetical protein
MLTATERNAPPPSGVRHLTLELDVHELVPHNWLCTNTPGVISTVLKCEPATVIDRLPSASVGALYTPLMPVTNGPSNVNRLACSESEKPTRLVTVTTITTFDDDPSGTAQSSDVSDV